MPLFSKIIITFNSIPAVDEQLRWNESVSTASSIETFKNSRSLPFQTKIPQPIISGSSFLSGYISTNYSTAIGVDLGSDAANFDITETIGTSGTGLGTVTITSRLPNAVFTIIDQPAGTTIDVQNEIYVEEIQIESITFSEATTDKCTNVKINVATNVLAVEVTEPITINPNTDNPFSFDFTRGLTGSVIVKDADDNTDSMPFTTPDSLNEENFTITQQTSFSGTTVTVTKTGSNGLDVMYSIDGGSYQTENIFYGVSAGVHQIAIKDQFGCAILIQFTVASQPIVYARDIQLSRSPQFVTVQAPGLTFDNATLELRVWRGNLSDRPTDATKDFSKLAVQAGQEKIVFDTHRVVNDFLKAKFNYSVQSTGAFPISTAESVFVETDASALMGDISVANQIIRHLAVDGFGYHIDLVNPVIEQKILSSITKHIYYGNNYRLYFVTDGLTSITINSTNVPFTFSQEQSNELIGYVNVAAYAGSSSKFNAVFVYGATTITHNIEKNSECRYQVYNCWFKNKFGVWQSIGFSKVSKESLDVTSAEFDGIILNDDSYDLSSHVTKTFSVEGKQKITVNSDFLPEAYNDLFKEMFLSESIYLENQGLCLPVNLAVKTFAKKTKVKDKLIQYSGEFNYSFNVINQVQ